MSLATKIEWTQATWNPVTGCSKVSPGCAHCYAERMARRLQAMRNPRYRNGFDVTLHWDLIDLPTRWRSPRTVFVNSMSDLFHENVPFEFIAEVVETMRRTPHHTYQILTKRSMRLVETTSRIQWPRNTWLGVTIEDSSVRGRLQDLAQVPAAVRFLSLEPLLSSLPRLDLSHVDWVIVGGESGPGARPLEYEWVADVHQQCLDAGVPFFFKQWGGVRKHVAGRELYGRTWDDMPSPAHYRRTTGSAQAQGVAAS